MAESCIYKKFESKSKSTVAKSCHYKKFERRLKVNFAVAERCHHETDLQNKVKVRFIMAESCHYKKFESKSKMHRGWELPL